MVKGWLVGPRRGVPVCWDGQLLVGCGTNVNTLKPNRKILQILLIIFDSYYHRRSFTRVLSHKATIETTTNKMILNKIDDTL